LRRDNEQRSGICPLLADAPMTPELVAKLLDLISLQRGQGDDHKLPAGLGLEVGQLALDGGAAGRVEHMRVVDHASGERGKARLGSDGGGKRERREAQEKRKENRAQTGGLRNGLEARA